MNDVSKGLAVLAVGCVALVACSEPVGESDNSDGADDVDTGVDVSESADVPDADNGGCDLPPAPSLGETPLADEWTDDASRCGQPSFSLLDDPSMGDVVALGDEQTFRASELEALADLEDITPPRDLRYDSRTQVFSYRTQDRGEVVEATALLAQPDTDDPDFEPSAPLLFLHGTVGFSDDCAPSASAEGRLMASVLASMGYTIVAPDFIGLKSMGEPTGFLHPYLVGQPTAVASLDALRGLYKMSDEDRSGHCYPHEYVSIGGSQGGHAALWVDRLATTYAPELEHLGSVATVPPADLKAQAEKALEQPVNATANTIAFFGASASWYGLDDRLDELFVSPLDTSLPEMFAEECSFDEISDEYEELEDVFTPAVLEAVDDGDGLPDPWGCMLEDNGLVTTDIDRHGPFVDSYATFFVLGEADNLVDTPIERDSVDELCDQGMPVSYLECADGPHGATTLWALPEILAFIDDRQQGVQPADDDLCVVDEPVHCEGTPED